MKITIEIAVILCFLACGNSSEQDQSSAWGGTRWIRLDQENIELRIPENFKRSSRYRIKEDLPILARDSAQLRLVQNSLEILELEDSEIDVFVDSSKTYRLIIICNTERIDFNSSDASTLKTQMKLNNEKIALSDSDIEFGEITAQMKGNSEYKLASYITEIRNILDNSTVYKSIYYLTGKAYTLVVYEFSEDEESFEKYLWTTKTG